MAPPPSIPPVGTDDVASGKGRQRSNALHFVYWLGLPLLGLVLVMTPGLFSLPSVLALLTTLSFVGCVAIGMVMITISGNIMSFSLGATAAVAAVAFVYAFNAFGLPVAVFVGLAIAAAVSAVQGVLIGGLRANPIIVSIASLALLNGMMNLLTNNATINAEAASILEPAIRKPFGFPIEAVIFLLCLVLSHFLLSYTAFGRHVFLVGSGLRAADVAAISVLRTITGVYACAGFFAGVAGILLAIRYNQASMEFGLGYDYDAIAGVLVGGVAIQGGKGSVWRAAAGMCFMSVIQVVLLLHGFRQEWQYLIAGLAVMIVILFQSRRLGGRE
jgi:ribose/xylose/arabinose/galactoside ABC-type transport system permease subunit